MASARTERREYFRVSDRLFMEFREVSYEESQVLTRNMRQPAPLLDPPVGAPEPAASGAGDGLFQYLQTIERKLDMLIELVTKREGRFASAYVDVNISGAGMRYRSETRVNEGACLEFRIGLPISPGRRVAAVGRVVRSRLVKTGDKEAWETGVKFVAMGEEDRDALISYVFSRERECLRTKQMP
jgi:hypothetical protein